MGRTASRRVIVHARRVHINEAAKYLMDEAVYQEAINRASDERIFARQIAADVVRNILPKLQADWRVTFPVMWENEMPDSEILKETRKMVSQMIKKLAPGFLARYDAISNMMVAMREENENRMWSGNSRIRVFKKQTSGGGEWQTRTNLY